MKHLSSIPILNNRILTIDQGYGREHLVHNSVPEVRLAVVLQKYQLGVLSNNSGIRLAVAM